MRWVSLDWAAGSSYKWATDMLLTAAAAKDLRSYVIIGVAEKTITLQLV